MGMCKIICGQKKKKAFNSVKHGDPRIENAFPNSWQTGEAYVKLFVGTWNVGNSVPSANLEDFVTPGVADIYMIGTQECKYKTPEGHKSFQSYWFAKVKEALGDGYVEVINDTMWQNNIIVMARPEIKDLITHVETESEATGIAGVIPNKGCCAACFSICDTSICFVSSHLAADQDLISEREIDYKEIMNNIRVGKYGKPLSDQFTHVVWCGDLNYRIDQEYDEVIRLIDEDDWSGLFRHDQLNKERTAQKVFYRFEEGELTFPPTYKHVHGDGPTEPRGRREYDKKKKRIPSWCDRIMWRSFPNERLQLVTGSYTSCPKVCSSDHSPVKAEFLCKVHLPLRRRHKFKEGTCKVQFSNLKGCELRATDFQLGSTLGENIKNIKDGEFFKSRVADPYCVFSAPYAQAEVKTEVVNKSCDPQWGGRYVLSCEHGIGDLEWLSKMHVMVTVWDRDIVTFPDPLGYGVISCAGAINRPVAFMVHLTYLGQPAGKLFGKIELQGPAVSHPLDRATTDSSCIEMTEQDTTVSTHVHQTSGHLEEFTSI